MSYMNSFGPDLKNAQVYAKCVYQDVSRSSPHWRNTELGRFFQPVIAEQLAVQEFQIGDVVRLRIRSVDNQDSYYTTMIRNIVPYATAQSVLGSYNKQDAFGTPFVSVLVLDQVW